MNPDTVVGLMTHTMIVALKIAAPLLIAGLAVGLVISIFQAVTQIQEMTLTFIPKIVAVSLGLLLFLPWMLQKLTYYTISLWLNLSVYVGK